MSPNGDLGYYADGLAEEITTTLAEAENLRVIPRTTAFHYRGTDLGTIAAELDVDGVLQGSVRKSGDTLRVSMQLIRASDGRQLWSESYDRPATGAFEIQEEIARTVAATLERRLVNAQRDESRFRPEPGAFETYLKASFEQDSNTPASIQRSIRLFEEVLDQDPDFAPAYAGLVNSYVLNIQWGFTPPEATRTAAGEAAERSLELGGAHPEAIAAAAAYHMIYEWDFDGAQELLVSAEDQDAPVIRLVRGWIAASRGRVDEALPDLRGAQASASHARFAKQITAWVELLSGATDEGLRSSQALVEEASDSPMSYLLLASALMDGGELDEAESALDRVDVLAGRSSPVSISARGILAATRGERAKAERLLGELDGLAEHDYVPATYRARVLLALGENDRALRELEKASENGSLLVLGLVLDPKFDPIRERPAFQEILQRANLL